MACSCNRPCIESSNPRQKGLCLRSGRKVRPSKFKPNLAQDNLTQQIRVAREAMKDKSILEEAQQLVGGSRQRDYGHPRENLDRIARIWSVILSTEVTPRQVALCMVGLKLARDVNTPKRDNLVDAVGYLLTVEMVDLWEAEVLRP